MTAPTHVGSMTLMQQPFERVCCCALLFKQPQVMMLLSAIQCHPLRPHHCANTLRCVVWAKWRLWLLLNLYLTDIGLILCDIILQREQQTLCVLRRKNNTATHLWLRETRQHCRKIDDKLRCGVRYNCQIGVVTLCHLCIQLDIQTRLVNLCHCFSVFGGRPPYVCTNLIKFFLRCTPIIKNNWTTY